MNKTQRAEQSVPNKGPKPFLNLVDIAWRAWRLRRFRDATLQRRLTELVTQAMPSDLHQGSWKVGENRYIRAWVTPIEPDFDIDLNRRVLGADKVTRHRVIDGAIAEGCRAAMQVMIPKAIHGAASDRGVNLPALVPCATAVKQHLESLRSYAVVMEARLPGSDQKGGPGLSEVCRQCRLRKRPVDLGDQEEWDRMAAQSLRIEELTVEEAARYSSWPHESDVENPVEPDRPYARRASARKVADEKQRQIDALRALAAPADGSEPWPKDGKSRPTVSFLFSGGVFRGVYQMGVLNALSQLGLRPDIIAGASVGSITAAMIAETFSLEAGPTRDARIARLAAVFLGIDRLILTDRVADFVRALTIRAADTRFYIRQVDRFLRKYDYPGLLEFDRNAREVVAGIERLLYLNPYQLNELVRAVRNWDTSTVGRLLHDSVQQFLDRMQIGEEALGAEALVALLDEYVPSARGGGDAVDATFDEFRRKTGIQLLVTATNLTRGRLDVPGQRPAPASKAATLRGAILASSAFPGVFRPRWLWEVYPGQAQQDRYIDGGVMDNLPFDAVGAFLDNAAKAELIECRPPGRAANRAHRGGQANESNQETISLPHLLVGASLEVDACSQAFAFRPNDLMQSWRLRSERARQLSYNIKLDMYVRTENRLREISDHPTQRSNGRVDKDKFTPVHMQVIAIKPEWLCGTFAFHPMLGFRRVQQAQSIAHGCASTLLTFARFAQAEGGEGTVHRERLRAWNVRMEHLPTNTSWKTAFKNAPNAREALDKGLCWLRDCKCPFSKSALDELKIPTTIINDIAVIHSECLKRETHLRKI